MTCYFDSVVELGGLNVYPNPSRYAGQSPVSNGRDLGKSCSIVFVVTKVSDRSHHNRDKKPGFLPSKQTRVLNLRGESLDPCTACNQKENALY